MGDVIDARHLFAPQAEDEYLSGQFVGSGVYVDTQNGMIVTLMQSDTLPHSVKILHLPCRFQRVENKAEAKELILAQEALRQAA